MYFAYARGADVRTSKLTENRVRLIKARWRERPAEISIGSFNRLMGWMHGVNASTIKGIVTGRNWGWIE